jgi:hypothetical protein
MPGAELNDLIPLLVAIALTLVIFSYLVRDNPAFRFAAYFLAGLSLSYALLVVTTNVLIPRVLDPLAGAFEDGDPGLALSGIVPLVFGTFILFKLSPRLAPWGNWGMAVLIGVGAGVAVGGALVGSLIGLSALSADWTAGFQSDTLAPLFGLLALVGTLTTLLYFWYTGRADAPGDARPAPVRLLAGIGQVFLMLTFGALFGGALVTGLAVLVDRLGLFTQVAARFIGQ